MFSSKQSDLLVRFVSIREESFDSVVTTGTGLNNDWRAKWPLEWHFPLDAFRVYLRLNPFMPIFCTFCHTLHTVFIWCWAHRLYLYYRDLTFGVSIGMHKRSICVSQWTDGINLCFYVSSLVISHSEGIWQNILYGNCSHLYQEDQNVLALARCRSTWSQVRARPRTSRCSASGPHTRASKSHWSSRGFVNADRLSKCRFEPHLWASLPGCLPGSG